MAEIFGKICAFRWLISRWLLEHKWVVTVSLHSTPWRKILCLLERLFCKLPSLGCQSKLVKIKYTL